MTTSLSDPTSQESAQSTLGLTAVILAAHLNAAICARLEEPLEPSSEVAWILLVSFLIRASVRAHALPVAQLYSARSDAKSCAENPYPNNFADKHPLTQP